MNKSKKKNELRELIGFKQKQRSKLSGGGGGEGKENLCTPQVGLEPTQGCCSSSIQANAFINFAIATYDVHGTRRKKRFFWNSIFYSNQPQEDKPFLSSSFVVSFEIPKRHSRDFCLSNGF